MNKLNKKQILALFFIALGVVLIFLSSRITYMFSITEGDIGPKAFPTFIGIGLVICGIGKFFSSRGKESKPFIKDPSGWLRLLLILWLFIFYILGLKYMGYIFSTIIFTCVLLKMLSSDAEKIAWWKILIFAVLMTMFSYLCFEKLINVMLPQGKWMKAIIRALRRR